MHKIKSISAKFRIVFQLAFIFVPLIDCVIWIFYEKLPYDVTVTLLPHTLNLNSININPTTKTLACLVSLLQVMVIWFALYQLVKLFRNYERGDIFSLANVGHYRKLGYTVFAWVFANKLVEALMSVVLTFQNPAGQRQLVISLGSTDLIGFAIGGLIILIAWIMNEGHKLNEEQALII
jgi:hypothetical protein